MHRDVKPENLLLDSRGQLKVTDLGISMETVDGVCTSTSGTRPYMAPEIFMAGHRHSYVADYYALGALPLLGPQLQLLQGRPATAVGGAAATGDAAAEGAAAVRGAAASAGEIVALAGQS